MIKTGMVGYEDPMQCSGYIFHPFSNAIMQDFLSPSNSNYFASHPEGIETAFLPFGLWMRVESDDELSFGINIYVAHDDESIIFKCPVKSHASLTPNLAGWRIMLRSSPARGGLTPHPSVSRRTVARSDGRARKRHSAPGGGQQQKRKLVRQDRPRRILW